MTPEPIILASGSASRRQMLEAAGVPIEVVKPQVDEDPIKEGLRAEGATARDIADCLAEAKALRVSRRVGPALVLGGDQILVTDDGVMFDKAKDPAEARDQLRQLSGATHRLISAVVMAEQGSPVWRHIAIAKLTMRELSDEFIAAYVDAHWDAIRHCVGCYQIEAAGAQLFAKVDGDQFVVRGLPLFAILDFLRIRGVMPK